MYSIQEVSIITGISTGNLRYYEKEKLLTDIQRSPGGIRQYTDYDLERLDQIRCLKNTGMSIREIARFMQLSRDGEHTLEERVEMLQAHREHIIMKLKEQQTYLEKITWKVGYYEKQLETFERKNKKL